MSKEELIAAIKKCAGELGRAPKFTELVQFYPPAKMGAIRKYLGTYTLALRESGLDCLGAGFEVTMDDLFRDWMQVVRKIRKVPNMTEYERESKYSVRPLVGRFKRWKQMPRGMYEYARQRKLDVEFADVLNIIRDYYKDEPESEWMLEKKSDIKVCGAFEMPDRPIYGQPLTASHLACGPTNEAGVLFLFGMLAGSLGFVVQRVQTGFPDIEALRRVGPERYQPVRIELEYESRNFLKHLHDHRGCDIIVCWTHNWPECPVEVIELKGLVGRLG